MELTAVLSDLAGMVNDGMSMGGVTYYISVLRNSTSEESAASGHLTGRS